MHTFIFISYMMSPAMLDFLLRAGLNYKKFVKNKYSKLDTLNTHKRKKKAFGAVKNLIIENKIIKKTFLFY